MPSQFFLPRWNYGHKKPKIPGPTEFEQTVKRLGLSEKQYKDSRELRQWVERRKNSRYVPENLLEEWGIRVDVEFTAT